jgi:hypothetical protein
MTSTTLLKLSLGKPENIIKVTKKGWMQPTKVTPILN